MENTQATFDHSLPENPMGEAHKDALRLEFDRRLRLEFHRSVSGKVSNRAGMPFMKCEWEMSGSQIDKNRG